MSIMGLQRKIGTHFELSWLDKALVPLVETYGCETWNLGKAQKAKITPSSNGGGEGCSVYHGRQGERTYPWWMKLEVTSFLNEKSSDLDQDIILRLRCTGRGSRIFGYARPESSVPGYLFSDPT